MYWRQVLARVTAHRGEYEEAESLAREAVAFGESTDMLWPRGLAQGDLPMVDQSRARLEQLL
jgi:hypothetical protein